LTAIDALGPWVRPRLLVALRAATAATMAWLVVLPLGGVADDYPYYAPLGAVIASTATVAGSIRTTLQTVVTIAAGAVLALAADLADLPKPVALALVVAVGTGLASWSALGAMATWVPVSGLFTLILGGSDPVQFALAYVGFTGVGALVASALAAAVPTLHLTALRSTEHALRATLAGELEDLSRSIRDPDRLPDDVLADRRDSIEAAQTRMRAMMAQSADARRANWRAHRWTDTAERRYRHARALDQLVSLVEDLWLLLLADRSGYEHPGRLPERLRDPAADAMAEAAAALRSAEGSGQIDQRLGASDRAADRLLRGVQIAAAAGEDISTAASVVTAVQRATATMRPGEPVGGNA
jgi:uncharacterized membrane protein YgaE (UPF0421/DUF939 family)